MTAGAVLVLVVTEGSTALGPQLTGLLTPFPVIASVLAVFTHLVDGPDAVRRYAQALLDGLPSFVVFTGTVAISIRPLGVAGGFSLAAAMTVACHALLILGAHRRAVPRERATST